MRIKYRRSFSQFIDYYLSSYFGAGGESIRRIGGGPVLMVIGAFFIVLGRSPTMFFLWRALLIAAGIIIILYGLNFFLRPAVNIFLVWLRREEYLGTEGATVTVELLGEKLHVNDPDGLVEIPLDKIQGLNHRADSTWIITDSSNVIYVPRSDLISGDHDEFIEALEALITTEEEV